VPAAKRVAHLVDATTLRVVDFADASAAAAAGGVAGGGLALATVSHDARIDWLVSLGWRGGERFVTCAGGLGQVGASPATEGRVRQRTPPVACCAASLPRPACSQRCPPPPAAAARPLTQELNQRGSHVLFRDKARRLFLFDVAAQEQAQLLAFCQYVQWVPGSDCVVAQSRGELRVWYGVNAPAK
jgi:hypothetical protein